MNTAASATTIAAEMPAFSAIGQRQLRRHISVSPTGGTSSHSAVFRLRKSRGRLFAVRPFDGFFCIFGIFTSITTFYRQI